MKYPNGIFALAEYCNSAVLAKVVGSGSMLVVAVSGTPSSGLVLNEFVIIV
jgi:hypothetical protein